MCVRINPPSILRSYIHAYNSHSFKDVFDVYALDLQGVAKSFGFENPPKVTLMLKANPKENDKRKGAKGGKGGRYSEENPYGSRPKDDKRQFSR